MINSVEEYEAMVESDDSVERRRAITDIADQAIWLAVLARRPDLAADVAMNKHLPELIRNTLIASNCSRVRSLMAMKRSLATEQFKQLAKDEDEGVRLIIANNKKVPSSILEKLTQDPWEEVANTARAQLRIRGAK